MRLMKRNLRPVFYRLYVGQQIITDDYGNETGESRVIYADPAEQMCNVSPASGAVQMQLFGVVENYDKILITDNMACPININTVLYVDESPERELSLADIWPADPTGNEINSVTENLDEYIVKRVAKSLHHISYAVSKVQGS